MAAPPGQGYYANIPSPNPQQHAQQPGAFPPPPNQQHAAPPPSDYSYSSAYEYGNGAPPPHSQTNHHHAAYSPPPTQSQFSYPRSFAGSDAASYRPYAPHDPRPHPGNMVEPYNEEKAYAEYTDMYGPPGGSVYSGAATAPSRRGGRPPNDYELGRERGGSRYEDDRGRYGGYDGRDRGSEESYEERRRSDRGKKEKAKPPKSNKDWLQQGDGQPGWASALLGGAAGAWIGHESGRGAVGTLSGLALGALSGKIVEKQLDKHQEKKREKVESSNPGVFIKGDPDGGRRRRREKSRGRRSSSSDSYDSYDAPPRRSQSGRRR